MVSCPRSTTISFCFLTFEVLSTRVIRESRARRDREMVEHEKRTEVSQLWCADTPPDSCASSFCLLDCQEGFADCARDCHIDYARAHIYQGKSFKDCVVCWEVGFECFEDGSFVRD